MQVSVAWLESSPRTTHTPTSPACAPPLQPPETTPSRKCNNYSLMPEFSPGKGALRVSCHDSALDEKSFSPLSELPFPNFSIPYSQIKSSSRKENKKHTQTKMWRSAQNPITNFIASVYLHLCDNETGIQRRPAGRRGAGCSDRTSTMRWRQSHMLPWHPVKP